MGRAETVIVLAAGQGTRMKSAAPKVLHPLCGRPMIAWVLDQARALDPERIVVVVGHGAERVREAVAREPGADRVRFALQAEQRGTGHAVQTAAAELASDPGTVVVLYGDMPLLEPETLEVLCEVRAGLGPEGLALLTAQVDDPRGFGRVVRDGQGGLARIVEERDADPGQREIPEINVGVYAFPGALLAGALAELRPHNAQGELYLTDAVAGFVAAGRPVETLEVLDPEEVIGVNTLAHLAEARWALQARIHEEHMERGVFIEDPASTYIDHGVEIGVGARILPCTVIRAGVRIGAGCEVGPFTHLRAGTVLEEGAEVGNFTECKSTRLGPHAKAKHLSYLGDADIGARVNIGAGTIFANYDGVHKHRSVVGERSFVGSGTIVVAPNQLGAGSTTGAGAVLTRDAGVGAGETWVGVPARRLSRARSSVRPSPDDPAQRRD